MRIIQLTPGAGGMYCGGCLRDNALVTALRAAGHDALLVPLYLPLTLDEPQATPGTPLFFGGIKVYLQQHSALFRKLPNWVTRTLSAEVLLRAAAHWAGKTRPEELGELTVSMLRGEAGRQASELELLLDWLQAEGRPDAVSLSNALLAGMAPRIAGRLKVPVLCSLQGEDLFLDGLPQPHREEAWAALRACAPAISCFVAGSRYYAEWMAPRLGLPAERIRVVPNGIRWEDFPAAPPPPLPPNAPAGPPRLGFLARMAPEKGLLELAEAFVLLKQRPALRQLRLEVAGSLTAAEAPFVERVKARLKAAGVAADAAFHPNLSRQEKGAFLASLTAFSVPATYGEAFGLYVLEALAAGVPVVQPRHGAFPEVLAATAGGVLCEPDDPAALAGALWPLLEDPARAYELGRAGRAAVQRRFGTREMAAGFAEVLRETLHRESPRF